MTQITDGKGSGSRAEVNTENQLVVSAVVATELEHESEENGQSYVWATDAVNPGTGGATVLLLKNTSDTPLHIASVTISGSTTSEYTIHVPTTEVTVTGNTVTGVNLNTASSNVAEASAADSETNNNQGNVLHSVFILASTAITINLDGLILGKNISLAVDAVADTTLSSVSITGHYAD